MTNALLDLLVLAVLTGVCWPVLRRLRARPLAATALVLIVLTLVFDTLMIRAGLYVYDPDKILGIYLWGAPVEDFAYAIAAAVGMPVAWAVLGRRARSRDEADLQDEAGSQDEADPAAGPAADPTADPA